MSTKLTLILVVAITGLLGCSSPKSTPAATPAETPSADATSQPSEPKAAAIGETCGGFANIACADGAFCDIEIDQPADDASGTCAERPASCPDIAQDPMPCGRDGKLHATECHANMEGVDIVGEESRWLCEKAE